METLRLILENPAAWICGLCCVGYIGVLGVGMGIARAAGMRAPKPGEGPEAVINR